MIRILEEEMALRSYGFGRWDAPYWFIGPEQGKGRAESVDNSSRVSAWRQLGCTELCDCYDFHTLISETDWHRNQPRLQSTWRPLMLALMTFLETPVDKESLRTYQRDKWGRSDGETCVIELSGTAVRSYRVNADRERFKRERIKIIRERLLIHKPKFVIMYGVSEKTYWEQIAGTGLSIGQIAYQQSSMMVLMPHPVAHGSKNSDWIGLGDHLRKQIVSR